MDASTFDRSASALLPFFTELVRAGACNAPMAALRHIGVRAESAMMAATGGVNTHRGAIFGMGLLCAAVGYREAANPPMEAALGEIVSSVWGSDIMQGPRMANSHGEQAGRRYGIGGARAEASHGFPSIYTHALPALRRARAHGVDANGQRVEACMALIAHLDDTNILHRGGVAGQEMAQSMAKRFIAEGGVCRVGWRERAIDVHAAFVGRNLSPGGAADLLAMTLFVDALGGAT